MPLSDFDTAWQSVADAFGEQFGKTYRYRQGGRDVDLTASIGVHIVEVNEQEGIYESWRGFAFLVKAEDLVVDEQTAEPARGDQIREELDDGTWKVYEVMPPPNSRCFVLADAEGFELAIYAKFARTEPA